MQPKTTKSHDSHPTQLSDLNNNPNMKFPKYILQLIAKSESTTVQVPTNVTTILEPFKKNDKLQLTHTWFG